MASIACALKRIKDDLSGVINRELVERICRKQNHVWRERELDPATTVALFMHLRRMVERVPPCLRPWQVANVMHNSPLAGTHRRAHRLPSCPCR
jgi:hypothetical protein